MGGGLWEYYTKAANDLGNSETQLYSDVKFGNKASNAPAAAFLQKQLTTAHDFTGNPEFVKALQAIGFEDSNTATATLIQRYPDFADHEVLDLLGQSLGPNGLKVDLQAVVHTQEITSQRLLDLIGLVRSDLVQQNALQASFKSYLDAHSQRQARIQLEKAQSQLDALTIEATRSSFYIVSTLVGFADPKLGRTLNGAGNAFLARSSTSNRRALA